jgi:hypothetical protein
VSGLPYSHSATAAAMVSRDASLVQHLNLLLCCLQNLERNSLIIIVVSSNNGNNNNNIFNT